MKTALQMYSVRAFMGENHIRNTLARVKDMGYDGAEWYGLLGYTPYQLAKLTTDAGLDVFSLHISIADLLAPDEEFMKETAETGVKYLPIGYLPEDRLAGSALFGETCDLIARYAENTACGFCITTMTST